MAVVAFPIINGFEYSFSSISVEMPGGEFNSLTAINYKSSKIKGRLHGNGQDQIGRTRGQKEYTADIELLRVEWEALQAALLDGAPAGAGIGDISFNILVKFADDGQAVVIDEINLCFVDEIDMANAQGTDGSTVKIPLSPGKILHNGKEI